MRDWARYSFHWLFAIYDSTGRCRPGFLAPPRPTHRTSSCLQPHGTWSGRLLGRYRLVPIDGLPRFDGGAVGYLGYECSRYFERLPAPSNDPLDLPDAVLLFTDTILVFDHIQHKIKVVSHVYCDEGIDSSYARAVDQDRCADRPLAENPCRLPRGTKRCPPVDPVAGREFKSNMSQQAYEEMGCTRQGVHPGR